MLYILLVPLIILFVYLFIICCYIVCSDSLLIITKLKITSRVLLKFILCFYLIVAATHSTKFFIKELQTFKENRARVNQLIEKGLVLEDIQKQLAAIELQKKLYEELRRQEIEEELRKQMREA